MRLADRLAQMETALAAMLEELQDLRMQVLALDAQNEQLRLQLYAQKDHREGHEHLTRLYEEGFHICPAHFASGRAEGEDCLFCLSFLQRRQRPE